MSTEVMFGLALVGIAALGYSIEKLFGSKESEHDRKKKVWEDGNG